MILFVTQFLPDHTNGIHTGGTVSNLNMLRAIARHSEIKVLSFDPSVSLSSVAAESFRVILRPAPPWRAAQLFSHWPAFVQRETRKALEAIGGARAVIATTSSLPAFDACPSGTTRIAIVQAYENFGFLCPWVPLRLRIQLLKLAAVHRFQDARLLRQADLVLTNSNFMRFAISRRFRIDPGRIEVMPQVAGTVPLADAPRPPPETVGFVHRGADKNIALVLELAKRAPNLRFLIFGHTASLGNQLPSNVENRGWADDRSRMFASAAIWIVPSVWAEPFGRVSIEAQAADRPVLVANVGGLPETVLDRSKVIDGYDTDLWLSRIRSALSESPDETRKNGALVRDMFSSARHEEKYQYLARRVLGGIS